MTTLEKLQELSTEANEEAKQQFGNHQEEAIISLALDHPEFYMIVGRFMRPDIFGKLECRWIIAEIMNLYEQYNVIPTRQLLRDHLMEKMTEKDPYEQVLAIVDRKSNPRETPIIKDTLLKWARQRAFGLLYEQDTIDAYHRGDYEYLETILQDANRIADIGDTGFWFFKNYEILFQPSTIEHRTTGFPRLDKLLNNGGPSPKEVVCFLAPTNVGKSLLLANNAITSLMGNGRNGPGQDVLLITYELDNIKTAMRCVGALTDVAIDNIISNQDYVGKKIKQTHHAYKKELYIHEFPPDECSVNHTYALLDNLRRMRGWRPDVIIIDYMDLMISRNSNYNKDDYTRQKHIATEIRGLAKNENVLIFTATQTNREGAKGNDNIDLTKAAESFGKSFPLDYVISLNQSDEELKANPSQLRMYIAKNRNGPKNEEILCTIKYNSMKIEERI